MKHEEKFCKRCGSRFECKVGDITNCQCNSVQLSECTIDFLSRTDYGCLCRNCLVEIDQMLKFSKRSVFPVQKELMVRDLHYYLDNGNQVLTELFHLQRGSCCGNDCRHCPYGDSISKSGESKNHESNE